MNMEKIHKFVAIILVLAVGTEVMRKVREIRAKEIGISYWDYDKYYEEIEQQIEGEELEIRLTEDVRNRGKK